MASEWIKYVKDLPNNPSVITISETCGINEDDVCGKLMRLWSWADTHSLDGHFPGTPLSWVDKFLGLSGFAIAMRRAGWLNDNGVGFSLVNFDRHNGKTAKDRILAAERKQRERAGTNVTPPPRHPTNGMSRKCHDASVTLFEQTCENDTQGLDELPNLTGSTVSCKTGNVTEMSRCERDKTATREDKIREDASSPLFSGFTGTTTTDTVLSPTTPYSVPTEAPRGEAQPDVSAARGKAYVAGGALTSGRNTEEWEVARKAGEVPVGENSVTVLRPEKMVLPPKDEYTSQVRPIWEAFSRIQTNSSHTTQQTVIDLCLKKGEDAIIRTINEVVRLDDEGRLAGKKTWFAFLDRAERLPTIRTKPSIPTPKPKPSPTNEQQLKSEWAVLEKLFQQEAS